MISRWPGIVVYRCGPLVVILGMLKLKDHGKPLESHQKQSAEWNVTRKN